MNILFMLENPYIHIVQTFLHNLFSKWPKIVFQTNVGTVKFHWWFHSSVTTIIGVFLFSSLCLCSSSSQQKAKGIT